MNKHLLSWIVFGCLLVSASEYKLGVYVGDAANPSLYLGKGESKSEFPAPPYSGMFGVSDIYILSQDAEPVQWYERLSEQILTTDGPWGIAVNSAVSLVFKVESGILPKNTWLSYEDPKKGFQATQLETDVSLSFKTGTVINVTVGDEPKALVVEDPTAEDRVFVNKDDNKQYKATASFDFNGTSMQVEFVGGASAIYYEGEEGAEEADWSISVSGASNYSWNDGRNILTIVLEGQTRDAQVSLSMTANNASATPVSTIITDPDVPGESKTLDWILQKFGTLDFDGDGSVSSDDVMYLYNFQKKIKKAATLTEDDLKNFTTVKSTQEKRQAALDYFRANTDDLRYGGDDTVTSDDVMYLYNFQKKLKKAATLTADDLKNFTTIKSTNEKREAALQTFKEYLE